jgi:hypothetical protein
MRASEVAWSAADVLVALPRFLTAPLYRHWHLRWGATDAEVAAAMPGDEIVPEPSFSATRAITIHAPPAKVWPWIHRWSTPSRWAMAAASPRPATPNWRGCGGRERWRLLGDRGRLPDRHVLDLLPSVARRDARTGRSRVPIDPDRSPLPAPAVRHYY